MPVEIKLKNFDEIRAALRESPQIVTQEAKAFLVRAMAVVRRVIVNDPWQVGGSGGGVPVDTYNLLQSHRTVFEEMRASIGPDESVAPYAGYVHDGTKNMAARPWLPYAEEQSEQEVNSLAQDMMKKIAYRLAFPPDRLA